MATRSERWAAALIVGTALGALLWPASGLLWPASGSGSIRRSGANRSRPALGSLTVGLRVSTTRARQLVGVTLTAEPSPAGSYIYYFEYGDGVIEGSLSPIASHGYREPGTYQARVGVVATGGLNALSPPVTIHVRYGLPPHVAITAPAPGGTVRPGGRIAGVATDPTGIRSVQVAIQLLSPVEGLRTGARCVWYDGRSGLVLSRCDAPYFFSARRGPRRWSVTIPASASLPPGLYAARVRARDNAGNVSSAYAVVLRTVVPFHLVR